MLNNAQNVEINSDVERNKVWGVLAYICAIIPLIAAPKDSEFSRFHTNQGLILMITSVSVHVVFLILFGLDAVISFAAFSYMFYIVTSILALIQGLFSLAIFALVILGIINVSKGLMVELPVIGKHRILK